MRFLTAGESHGEKLIAIIEGLPSGLVISTDKIDEMLARRQNVYGRSERQSLRDKAKIVSGLNDGKSTGAPLAIEIPNGNCGKKGDFEYYRPGHVDMVADMKYCFGDPTLGAERASARETAVRTAVGAVAKQMLELLGITVNARVTRLGDVDIESNEQIKREIDKAVAKGETLGGRLVVTLGGVISGIGSYAFWDRRLDALFAGALMSIPSVKAVECGLGVRFCDFYGSEVADCIVNGGNRPKRISNNCGGIEGGISNGEDIVFTLTLKPIPSISGLSTVNKFGDPCKSGNVRSDVCAVPAACAVAEAVSSFVLLSAIIDCVGGDTVDEVIDRYNRKGATAWNKKYL